MNKKIIGICLLSVLTFSACNNTKKDNTTSNSVTSNSQELTTSQSLVSSQEEVSSVESSEVISSSEEKKNIVDAETFLTGYFNEIKETMKKDFSYEGKIVTTATNNIEGTYDKDTEIFHYEDNNCYDMYHMKEDGLYNYKKINTTYASVEAVLIHYVAFEDYIRNLVTVSAICTIEDKEYKAVNGEDSITMNILETGLKIEGNLVSSSTTFDLELTYGNVDTTLL